MPDKTLAEFISKRKVFRFDEAVKALGGPSKAQSIAVGLNYHVAQKRIVRLRRGLYCRSLKDLDVWHVASRITSDAVIAYQSALRFHLEGSYGHEMQVLSEERISHFVSHDCEFRTIKLDRHRLRRELTMTPAFHGILEVDHEGMRIRVVSLERALVDCLDRPDLTDGLESVVHEFFRQRDLKADALLRFARANESGICASRLGLVMQSHRQLHRETRIISRLMELKPKKPTIFDPADKEGLCAPMWNAILPGWFLELRGHRHHLEPNLH